MTYLKNCPEEKVCPKCRELLPREEFATKSGRHLPRCYKCRSSDYGAYYEANREAQCEKSKQWRLKNPLKRAQQIRNWWKKRSSEDTPGLYKVTHVPTGIVYYGNAENLEFRQMNHFAQFNRPETSPHHNPTLRTLSKYYSPETFEFQVLCIERDKTQRDRMEKYLIQNFACCNVQHRKIG